MKIDTFKAYCLFNQLNKIFYCAKCKGFFRSEAACNCFHFNKGDITLREGEVHSYISKGVWTNHGKP